MNIIEIPKGIYQKVDTLDIDVQSKTFLKYLIKRNGLRSVEYGECPECRKLFTEEEIDEQPSFCSRCGQALYFPDNISHDDYLINRERERDENVE